MKYQAVIQALQKLEISILAVISKIYSHISLSQKNKTKLTAFNVATVLIELGKSQPEPLQNRVGNIGWSQCGKCLGFFRMMIMFSNLTSISHILILL